MIRDQIVDACKSTELRRKFLAAQNLTLEKVQKIGRTYELAVMHSEKMEQPKEENSENETISKLQKKSRQQFKPRGAPKSLVQKFNPPNTAARFSRETALCYRCGRAGHYGRHCRISRDIVCRKCGRTGHFAKMCKPKQPNKVNTIMQVEEYSDEEVFTLTEKENAHITVEMEGKVVSILIDSGSSINAMDKHTFDSLTSSQVVKKTTTTIHPYSSKTPLKLIGKCTSG